MKTIITILLLLSLQLVSNCQTVQPIKVNDQALSRMFNNINTYQRFFSGDLSVAVIEISNPAGSAKTEETEESTSNLYLAISEIDTYPKQNLFCIKDLYAIRNIKQDNSVAGELRVSFTYVDLTQKKPLKKDITLKIGLETVTVIKSN